jgi:hypothetical protein
MLLTVDLVPAIRGDATCDGPFGNDLIADINGFYRS